MRYRLREGMTAILTQPGGAKVHVNRPGFEIYDSDPDFKRQEHKFEPADAPRPEPKPEKIGPPPVRMVLRPGFSVRSGSRVWRGDVDELVLMSDDPVYLSQQHKFELYPEEPEPATKKATRAPKNRAFSAPATKGGDA